jgi:hypothetical protein
MQLYLVHQDGGGVDHGPEKIAFYRYPEHGDK